MAPEFRERRALDFDVLDPFGVFRGVDRRDHFGEMDLDCLSGGGIDVDAFGSAIEIAGLAVPVLAFAFVHGQLHDVAVGSLEGGVLVEDALDPIVSGGEVVKIGGDWASSSRICVRGSGSCFVEMTT